MRLLTKKIHRAYPELDKFEDDVCTRYVNRAKRLQNAWKGWLFILLTIPIALVVWVFIFWATSIFHFGLQDQYGWYASDAFLDTMVIIGMTGFFWFPAILSFMTRDRWLHRCIRKQLAGVQCGACGYSLLGLSINNENDTPSVHCPECGHHLILKDMGLTQADIDPNYQPATP